MIRVLVWGIGMWRQKLRIQKEKWVFSLSHLVFLPPILNRREEWGDGKFTSVWGLRSVTLEAVWLDLNLISLQ